MKICGMWFVTRCCRRRSTCLAVSSRCFCIRSCFLFGCCFGFTLTALLFCDFFPLPLPFPNGAAPFATVPPLFGQRWQQRLWFLVPAPFVPFPPFFPKSTFLPMPPRHSLHQHRHDPLSAHRVTALPSLGSACNSIKGVCFQAHGRMIKGTTVAVPSLMPL